MVFRRVNGPLAVGQLRHEMDRLYEDYFGPMSALQRAVTPQRAFPALNLWEQGDNLMAEAELPGLKSEDVEVTVVGNELLIKGRRPVKEDEALTFHRRERGVGEFARALKLPVEVDAEKVQASLQDGVLRLTLPKAAAALPRKIQVQAG